MTITTKYYNIHPAIPLKNALSFMQKQPEYFTFIRRAGMRSASKTNNRTKFSQIINISQLRTKLRFVLALYYLRGIRPALACLSVSLCACLSLPRLQSLLTLTPFP